MSQCFTYSIPPHALPSPATADRICVAEPRPHTYGVRHLPCGPLTTEPCRPTACNPCGYPRLTARYSLFPANSTDATPAPPAHPILNSSFFILNWAYTFSAKEKDSETGLSYFGSRYYSSDLSIWLSVDPMAAKYPGLGPYVYCADNPVKLVDPNGEEIGIFIDSDGNCIGNDGKDDNRRYVIKTTAKDYGGVSAANLSQEEYNDTYDFISKNSGKKEEFEKNDIAYRNSVEIENSLENLNAIKKIIFQDKGALFVGYNPSDNREYGGRNENGTIVQDPAGNVSVPQRGASMIIYRTENTIYTFHTHCSGWDGNFFYKQHASQDDIDHAGSTINYCFGMNDRTVYIYNKDGIQATLPIKAFFKNN